MRGWPALRRCGPGRNRRGSALRTQVLRSNQFVRRVRRSTPTTSARRTGLRPAAPDAPAALAAIMVSATVIPYTKPEQAAFTSNAMAFFSPSRRLSMPAAEGTTTSDVTVAQMIRSISAASIARSVQPSGSQPRARRAADSPRSALLSVRAIWRLLMPVRVVIHSSFVSTSALSSSFPTSSAGRAFPQPMIVLPISLRPRSPRRGALRS